MSRGIARNDCDDWNPASSVGLTATEVAAARAVASRRRTALISDPFAEPLVRAVGLDFFTQLAEENSEQGGSAFAMPGMVDWVAARTRFFDDYFTAAQATGIRQSVILGAGLDSRAYRLIWSAGSTLYEVDQPGVIDFKSATMMRLRARPRVDRRPVAVDLRGDWVPPLRQCGYNPSLPTAWIAEGLLPYLPPDDQDHLLDNISALSAAGSWFAADTATDAGELAARIATSLGGNKRPIATKVDIAPTSGTSRRVRRDDAHQLRLHGWACTSFAAPHLFASYALPAPANDEDLYQHIVFLTAFRAHA